jgi:hypothetical protein
LDRKEISHKEVSLAWLFTRIFPIGLFLVVLLTSCDFFSKAFAAQSTESGGRGGVAHGLRLHGIATSDQSWCLWLGKHHLNSDEGGSTALKHLGIVIVSVTGDGVLLRQLKGKETRLLRVGDFIELSKTSLRPFPQANKPNPDQKRSGILGF